MTFGMEHDVRKETCRRTGRGLLSPWKSLFLHLYYYGSWPRRRWAQMAAVAEHRVPIVVLFYHRIADDQANDWTTSNLSFRRQIDWMSKHFDLISLEEVQRRIRTGDNRRPCVSITFDDGYAENTQKAIPLLVRRKIPCTYFVTLGNLLSGDPFAHDASHGNHFLPNNLEQIRAMSAAGIEIGAHTYTHPNLATITDDDQLYREVITAGEELGRLIDRRIRYFAAPIGQYFNLSRRLFELAQQAGYEALCSAYGGYNFPGGDPFHLQRFHGDEELIRLKNRVTIDPRKLDIPRFAYQDPSIVTSTELRESGDPSTTGGPQRG